MFDYFAGVSRISARWGLRGACLCQHHWRCYRLGGLPTNDADTFWNVPRLACACETVSSCCWSGKFRCMLHLTVRGSHSFHSAGQFLLCVPLGHISTALNHAHWFWMAFLWHSSHFTVNEEPFLRYWKLDEFKEFFLTMIWIYENNASFNEIEAGCMQGMFSYWMVG